MYRNNIKKKVLGYLLISLIAIFGVFINKASPIAYETYFRYSDTTADSVTWDVFFGGDTLINGKASKWYGENNGLFVDTVTIGSQNALWVDFKIWTGTDYDFGGYYLNQRANVVAIADDSTSAKDIDSRVDSILSTATLSYLEVINVDGWNPIIDNDSLIIDQSTIEDLSLASRSKIGDTSLGVDEVLAEVTNINGWSPIIDNDSLIIDQSTLEDMTIATVTTITNQVTADITAISGDASVPDTLEAWLDGYGNTQLTNREHLFTNLDEVISTRSKIGDTAIGGDEILAEVVNLNGWAPILDNDSLIIDQSSLEDLSLASRVKIGDTSQGVDEVLAEVENLNGWSPILDNDSLIIDQSSIEDLALASRSPIGDTSQGVDEVLAEVINIDAWNPITDNDSLIVDQSTLEDLELASRIAIGDTSQGVDEIQIDVTEILDTLKSHDNWIARQGFVDSIYDTLLIIQDSIENYDNWLPHQNAVYAIRDTLLIIQDSIENYDNWIAKEATLATINSEVEHIDGWNPATDSVNVDQTGYSLSTAGIDAILEYDTANISAGIGQMLKDTSAYQGAASSVSSIVAGVWNADTSLYNTAQSFAKMIKDTSAYQGVAASGPAMASAVWNALQSNYTIQGSFGAYLDDTISGISLSPDSGGNVLTLVALDTANNTNVPFLKHSCQNVDGSVDYSFKYTTSAGSKTWALDNGSYIFTTSGYNYIQESVPDTVVVFGNTTDTLELYPFDPGGPTGASAASKCRVWSRIFNKNDGTGREGVIVTVTTPNKLRYGNVPIYQFAESTSTDSTGYWYFDLIRSDSLSPSDKATYQFISRDTLEIVPIFDITRKIPDSSSWQLQYWR